LAILTSLISFSIIKYEGSNRKYPILIFIISQRMQQWLNCFKWCKLCYGFDTNYTIKGTKADYNKTKDLVVSTISDDFTNSSTSDYIKVEEISATSSSNATGLANPFSS